MIRKFGVGVVVMFFSGALLAQTPAVIPLSRLEKMISEKGTGIKVINFWATWCGPCIKELPFFEKVNKERSDVKVLLVSMDMDLDPDSLKVIKFAARRKIASRVFILNEKDPNQWISRIDKTWSGALPATLIINEATGKKLFTEGELHEGELEKIIAEIK